MNINSIADICERLLSINTDISSHMERLGKEREDIISLMNRAQSLFGDTMEGQELVLSLSAALKSLSEADASLYLAKSDICEYVTFLKK